MSTAAHENVTPEQVINSLKAMGSRNVSFSILSQYAYTLVQKSMVNIGYKPGPFEHSRYFAIADSTGNAERGFICKMNEWEDPRETYAISLYNFKSMKRTFFTNRSSTLSISEQDITAQDIDRLKESNIPASLIP